MSQHHTDCWLYAAIIVGVLILVAAGLRHPGWESRPAPVDPAAGVRLPAPQAPGLDADGLGRVLREAVVKYQEVR